MYTQVQGDQIRIFDVIETVNDTPCHKILLPEMDLQERFEHSIEERACVKLELNRCIALQPVSSPLAFGRLVNQKHMECKYAYMYVVFCSKEKISEIHSCHSTEVL